MNLDLEPDERVYLEEMRSITFTQNGIEVFAGHDREESLWYLNYARAALTDDGPYDPESRDKYLALHEKHEKARIQILAAENEMRNSKPTVR